MEKGKFYKSKTNNLIVKCSEPENENGSFSGYVVSGESTFQPLNHFSEWWNALNFKEIFPDQISGYHTSVRNTHPTFEDFNQKQVIGLQGQIAEAETKSKGEIRNIENHRMQIWNGTVMSYIRLDKFYTAEKLASFADNVLAEFDKRFNNK